jgi:hypothetical protein
MLATCGAVLPVDALAVTECAAVTKVGQSQSSLVLYDAQELRDAYIPVGPTPPVEEPIPFDVFGYDCPESTGCEHCSDR